MPLQPSTAHDIESTSLTAPNASTGALMEFIHEADRAALDQERAREAVEQAKAALEGARAALEQSRQAFEQTMSKAESVGLARAKAKKLIEERTTALLASGLVSTIVSANDDRPSKSAATKNRGSSPKRGAKAIAGETDVAAPAADAPTVATHDVTDEDVDLHAFPESEFSQLDS